MPDGIAVARPSSRHGLALEGLAGYHHGTPPRPPALVIGYATPPDHAYSGALARLLAALDAIT